MSDPAARIRVIKESLRCFVLGLFGLVPVLGLPAAWRAIHLHGRIRRDPGAEWNPACAYARWGCFFGGMGVAVAVAVFGFVVVLAALA